MSCSAVVEDEDRVVGMSAEEVDLTGVVRAADGSASFARRSSMTSTAGKMIIFDPLLARTCLFQEKLLLLSPMMNRTCSGPVPCLGRTGRGARGGELGPSRRRPPVDETAGLTARSTSSDPDLPLRLPSGVPSWSMSLT